MLNRREAIGSAIGALVCASTEFMTPETNGESRIPHCGHGLKYHRIFHSIEWSIADNAWLLAVFSINLSGGGYAKTSKHNSKEEALAASFVDAMTMANHLIYIENRHDSRQS